MAESISFAEFTRRIGTLGDKMKDEVSALIGLTASDIVLEATRNAPGPGDPIATEHGAESQEDIARGRGWVPIAQAIEFEHEPGGLSALVYVERAAGELAVYVEVGTGQSARSYLATLPPEWQAAARKFYINGQGTIINKPYMYPAIQKYEKIFVDELRELVKDLRI